MTIENATIPVIANVSATAMEDATEIKKNLFQQLYSPVLWEDQVFKK